MSFEGGSVSTRMDNPKAEILQPDPYCEQFQKNILNQITALLETGLKSTDKLKLIGNLTRLEHCKDCLSTQSVKTEDRDNPLATTCSSSSLMKTENIHLNDGFCSETETPTNVDARSKKTLSKGIIACPVCGKSNFGPKNPVSGLKRHMQSVHKDKSSTLLTVGKSPTPTGIKCPHCEKLCKNQAGLRRHLEYKHKDTLEQLIDDQLTKVIRVQ